MNGTTPLLMTGGEWEWKQNIDGVKGSEHNGHRETSCSGGKLPSRGKNITITCMKKKKIIYFSLQLV